MLKFLTIPVLFISMNGILFSKNLDSIDFQAPLDIPLFLSGNFGELRANHFHAGLDFKTQSVVGKPVFAAFEGYISRIKVQSGGYGLSIYITHPNGFTTLYAHLDQYIPEIEAYVKHNQYIRKSYEVELFPSKEMFSFKKGNLIAYSGNTGRSGGPHLHFEVRKTAGQVPVNGLFFGFPIKDNVAPEFRKLILYNYSTSEPVANNGESRHIKKVWKKDYANFFIKGVIEFNDEYVGFGTEVYDFLNGSGNRCGVYSLALKISGQEIFKFEIDAVSFAKSRFINAHMDYDLKMNQKIGVHRLFALPNNTLPIYSENLDGQLFMPVLDSIYQAEVIAKDVFGNSSKLSFSFKRIVQPKNNIEPSNSGYKVEWDKGRKIELEGLSVTIPAKALYQDVHIDLNLMKNESKNLSDTIVIHKSAEGLHQKIKINYKLNSTDSELTDKLLFTRVNGKNELIAEESTYSDGFLQTSTRYFGTFLIVVDTIQPIIRPLKFISGKIYKQGEEISFRISDDLSGINKYEVLIDGQWALFRFDAKSGKLSYNIEKEYLSKDSQHSILVKVEDYKHNVTILKDTFKL